MTYTLSYKNQILNLDRYCLKNESMAGEKIHLLLDTEEELAYYAFKHNFYKTGFLNTVCSYNDLYSPEGKRISDNELNNIIKKHLPIETQKIDKRKQLCDNKFVTMLMNVNKWKILTYWINLHKELIDQMPIDQKEKFTSIEEKNLEYIKDIESTIKNKQEEKILAEKAAGEATDTKFKKFKKI